jgi:hypothetical protein
MRFRIRDFVITTDKGINRLNLRSKILKQHTKCGCCKHYLTREKHIYPKRTNGDMESVNNYHVLCDQCHQLIVNSNKNCGYRSHNSTHLTELDPNNPMFTFNGEL